MKIAAGLFLLAPLIFAADYKPLDVKTGLWENTMTTQMTGMPPIPDELLAKMSPEQRARMEEARKAREAKGAQTSTHKSCITKEDLNKPLNFGDDKGACTRTFTTSTSTRQEIHMECAMGNIKSSGDVKIEALNSETVKGTGQMSSTGGGPGMKMNMTFSGKWLGSDCGDLKK